VAVKVQRPGIPEVLALDAHLLRLLGGLMQGFAGTRGDLVAVVDEMVKSPYSELISLHPLSVFTTLAISPTET
jgi:predicted unusual protein kinase regulating ubiquinone biosynthesis (AarF/ABC1/UbiB family)